MKKRFRLRRTEDFRRVRYEGREYRHPFLIARVAPNRLTHNRYGIVTAKGLGNAVVRNRVRRLIRESVRLLHPNLVPGYDVVIFSRPPVVGQPFKQVQSALTETFRRAAMLINGDNES